MPRVWCLILVLVFVVVVATAISAVPRQTADQQSLKNALDAVTRKQRSLDFVPQNYYNQLRSFKFHPGDAVDDKFERERQHNQDIDDNDNDDDAAADADDDDGEDLEFLPLDNGQLENIGGGYQNFNNKRLERALMDYLENSAVQRGNIPSPFRERERSGGHKRDIINERATPNEVGNKELAALFYNELQNGPNYNTIGDVDNQDYLLSDTLQSYYDSYRAKHNKLERNKLYESSSDPMSWGEIFGKQESVINRASKKNDQDDNSDDLNDHDQEPMYLLPTERRNVNGRYPLGREYGVLLKRYPLLTKRSPKPLQSKYQNAGIITDPKVAKDLGALFGGQTAETKNNETHDDDERDKVQHGHHEENDHHEDSHVKDEVNGDGKHSYDHDHGNDHGHDLEDNDDDGHATSSGPHGLEATSSAAPIVFNGSQRTTKRGQKEISNVSNKVGQILSKRDHRAIQIKKKSVDWSDYFGIDRRKKKAALLARPGSQDQDDEWMLQRYYKTMAENLKTQGKNPGLDKDNSAKRDKLDQMDTRLKNVKNLIVEDAMKYNSEENSGGEEVKDVVMARLAAAYSLEKMRRALNEFRSNIAAQKELMRAAHAKNTTTSNFWDERNENENIHEKRNGNSIADRDSNSYEGRNLEGVDEGRGCLELENIERMCRPAKGLIAQLYEPCVVHQICRACDDEEECSNMFAVEAAKVCKNMRDSHERGIREAFGHCAQTARVIWQMQPSPIASVVCHSNADSCLRRQYRYRHRALYYSNGWLPHVAVQGPDFRQR